MGATGRFPAFKRFIATSEPFGFGKCIQQARKISGRERRFIDDISADLIARDINGPSGEQVFNYLPCLGFQTG